MPAATEQRLPTLDELNQEMARRHHVEFMQATWQREGEPFVVGLHTASICSRIDRAIVDYRAGLSTFLIVMVPFRHGKSDIVSRYLPPHFIGLFPDAEVMLATYASELANDLSRFARRIAGFEAYMRIFPGVTVAEDSSAVNRWGVQGRTGGMVAAGLGGSMTGRGYALGIVDDYLKNRAEAESRTTRDHIWDSFTNDFLTRRAPVSITMVVATPWHVDDLIGRIQSRMHDDAKFPQFEILRFPAFDPSYASGTLFPERMPLSWYEGHRATLGTYGTASLLQCQPQRRGGNLLKIAPSEELPNAGVQFYDEAPAGLRWVRAWDLASSKKEVVSDDPDFTVGMRMAVQILEGVKHLWIDDVWKKQVLAPERDRVMEKYAELDGPRVRIGIETVAGYKDTYDRFAARMRGKVIVEQITPSRDLVARCEDVAPIFEAGNVHIRRAPWTADLVQDLGDFPSGAHDDTIAAMMAGFDLHGRAAEFSAGAAPKRAPITAGMRGRKF